MLTPVTTKQFQKDVKRAKNQGRKIEKLKHIMTMLVNEEPLPAKNRPHKLTGDFNHHHECHITPDWLLIYKIGKKEVIFERAGSHSELFKK